MQLYFHPFSPFARKVRVLLREGGIQSSVTEIEINPFADEERLRSLNPLAKVPVLVTDEGAIVYDSPTIVQHLAANSSRVSALCTTEDDLTAQPLLALADGLCDLINHIRSDETRFGSVQDDAYGQRLLRGCAAALETLGQSALERQGPIDLVSVSIACALSYARFRNYSPDYFRLNGPVLEWLDAMEQRASFKDTAPD